jgi:hypothetical protein
MCAFEKSRRSPKNSKLKLTLRRFYKSDFSGVGVFEAIKRVE